MNIENLQHQTRSLRRRKGPPVVPEGVVNAIAEVTGGDEGIAVDAAGGRELSVDAAGDGFDM